jgi:hypothetical protein
VSSGSASYERLDWAVDPLYQRQTSSPLYDVDATVILSQAQPKARLKRQEVAQHEATDPAMSYHGNIAALVLGQYPPQGAQEARLELRKRLTSRIPKCARVFI